MTNSFSDFPLIPEVQSALRKMGFSEPTPIQAGAIPALLEGKDLLGCAQTGTGKTAAFGIPLVQLLQQSAERPEPTKPQALVLAPTRELVVQIAENLLEIGKHTRIRQTVVYGGVGQRPQVAALARGVHILIATPGRLRDLIGQEHCSLSSLRHFVLDEADRMLDMGFMPDIQAIIKLLPRRRQSIFLSATMPPPIETLAGSLLHKHVTVMVAPPATTAEKVKQRVMLVERSNKRPLLDQLLRQPDATRVLVFMKTKHGADRLYKTLIHEGLSADGIHSGRSQNARQRVLTAFRNGAIKVLISTDVAARGIDVEGISHVINYDVPQDPDSYVHRIGRTARAGAAGESITLCDQEEFSRLRDIEKLIGQAIPVDRDHPFHSSEVDDVELHDAQKRVRGDKPRTNSRDRGARKKVARDDSSKPHSSRSRATSGRSSRDFERKEPSKGRRTKHATDAVIRKGEDQTKQTPVGEPGQRPRKLVASRDTKPASRETSESKRNPYLQSRSETSRPKSPTKRRRSLSGKIKKIKLLDSKPQNPRSRTSRKTSRPGRKSS